MSIQTIIIGIIAFSFLIFIHELGHFTVAKLCKIRVNEFSLFMGPKLFSFKKGETEYSLRLVPIGGYVKMEGEEENSDDERAYNRKPVWQRFLVIAAGPIMNIVVAILLIFLVYINGGYGINKVYDVQPQSPAAVAGIEKGDVIIGYDGKAINNPQDYLLLSYTNKGEDVKIKFKKANGSIKETSLKPNLTGYVIGIETNSLNDESSLKITNLAEGYPADLAGLKVDDVIVGADNIKFSNLSEFKKFMMNNKNNKFTLNIVRKSVGNDTINIEITPKEQKNTNSYSLGFEFDQYAYSPWAASQINEMAAKGTNIKPYVSNSQWNPGEIVKDSVLYSYSIARSVAYSLKWLFAGVVKTSELSGPVGIVSLIGKTVQQDTVFWWIKIFGLIQITAFISINVGIFNLIPFPALDGSKLVILIVEKIRRKPLAPEKEATISLIGLAILMLLVIYATYNDIVKGIFGG